MIRSPNRAWTSLLAAAVLVAAGCSGGNDDGGASAPGSDVPARGVSAPEFAGDLLSGGEFDSGSMLGRPLVVNFWATTCEPCIREMPELAGAAADHADQGLIVVGVNLGEPVEMIDRFLDGLEIDLDFPIMLDPLGEVARAYRVVLLPTTYFVDREGTIQYRRIGELGERHLVEGLARIM